LANNEAVPPHDCHRVGKSDLHPSCVPRSQFLRLQDPHSGLHLGRAGEEIHGRVVGKRLRSGLQQPELSVEQKSALQPAWGRDNLPPLQVFHAESHQVDSHAASGLSLLGLVLGGLEPPEARTEPQWLYLNFLPHFEVSIYERACDDGPKTGDGEGSVNRKAGLSDVRPRLGLGQKLVDLGQQLGQSCAGESGHGHYRGVGQRCVL